MSATVAPLPPNPSSETTDFLRRMASMVSGRNGEMLLRAAALIESLTQRAMSAERLYHREHEENTLLQLQDVASRAERAALMADGHVGYVMPIGGVAAYRNKVSVVGVFSSVVADRAAATGIAGRMTVSVKVCGGLVSIPPFDMPPLSWS